MPRAKPSGSSLTYRDTQFVRGMLLRGDRQHDIAAYYGVNAGRIAEIATLQDNYPKAEPMPEDQLPPPGPYVSKYAMQSVLATLNEAIQALDLAEAEEDVKDVKAAILLAKEIIQKKINSLEEA